jgi:hypothetical protein
VPGEVVVRITTDMVVPQDIDTVAWTVTVAGDTAPFQGDAVDLTKKPLPATLAIVAPHASTQAVQIVLDGLHEGTPRVHREATVTVPAAGPALQLAMPLNWLCTHDASPALECATGQTCQAGGCVSSLIDASTLAPYVSAPEAGCFDLKGCFFEPPIMFPDTSAGHCAVHPSAGVADVDVALVIDPSFIGNYGECQDTGSCLIPLVRGGPEGWTASTDNSGGNLIDLPAAVCDDWGARSLLGVITAPLSPGCSPTTVDSPTCAFQPDTCLKLGSFGRACPSDWGSDWSEYTCSGSALPYATDPNVTACGSPPDLADAGTDAGGAANRWCCTTGTGGPPGSLLIDDMSGGPQVKIAAPGAGEIAGFWWTFSDDFGAPLIPARLPSVFTYTAIPASPQTPDGGPLNAACLTSPAGFTGYYAGEGFNFVWPRNGSLSAPPFDVSSYTGIQFWAWSRHAGQRIKVSFPDSDTNSADPRFRCPTVPVPGDGGSGCGNDWAIQDLMLSTTWTLYSIRWDQLVQADWGTTVPSFNEKQVFATVFEVTPVVPIGTEPTHYHDFEFCVSQIYFTSDAGTDAGNDAGTDAGNDAGTDATP